MIIPCVSTSLVWFHWSHLILSNPVHLQSQKFVLVLLCTTYDTRVLHKLMMSSSAKNMTSGTSADPRYKLRSSSQESQNSSSAIEHAPAPTGSTVAFTLPIFHANCALIQSKLPVWKSPITHYSFTAVYSNINKTQYWKRMISMTITSVYDYRSSS